MPAAVAAAARRFNARLPIDTTARFTKFIQGPPGTLNPAIPPAARHPDLAMTDQPHKPRHSGNDSGVGVLAERVKPKLKKPPLYKVLLLNDDYTPMEFVVLLLMRFFNLSQEQAEQIMIHIHTRGLGVCGVFPREIAETKVRLTLDFAQQNQHPLQCTMERE